ncbi:hypothetical protein HK105_203945 [Polyrhizophydium stewartii]|uniref:Uncharacterized protein n=1 Tax=Polyrhizophydium stewartii TaxID=2732419 RepID=A0ABR4NAG4_9FUNG|nr:hypothetical protein HK105_007270 [Polyrhizophydium stewartii]
MLASEAASLRNRIALVGGDAGVREQLLRELLVKTGQSSVLESEVWPPRPLQLLPFVVDTKYYSAALSVVVYPDAGVLRADYGSADQEHAERRAELGQTADAVVLLLDGATTMSRLKATLGWIEEFVTEFGTNIALAVTPSGESGHADYAEMELACMDAGVELIAWRPGASATGSAAGAFGSLLDDAGDLAEELVGTDRIAEALQTNMWAGMVRMPQPPLVRRLVETDFDEKDEDADDEDRTRISHTTKDGDAGGNSDSADGLLGYSMAEIEKMSNMLFGSLGKDDEDADGDQDGFEHTVMMLQRLREQGQQMSSEERRVLAEKTALAFHLHLAADGDEDEDDDQDDQDRDGGVRDHGHGEVHSADKLADPARPLAADRP